MLIELVIGDEALSYAMSNIYIYIYIRTIGAGRFHQAVGKIATMRNHPQTPAILLVDMLTTAVVHIIRLGSKLYNVVNAP